MFAAVLGCALPYWMFAILKHCNANCFVSDGRGARTADLLCSPAKSKASHELAAMNSLAASSPQEWNCMKKDRF